MELSVMPRPEVVKLLGQFVTVQLFTDIVPIKSITLAQRKQLAEKNQDRIIEMAKEATNPFYVVVAPDGQILSKLGGAQPRAEFVDFLNGALAKAQNGRKVAQIGLAE
jgi:thiol:disulfide interchange protein DsbD